MSWNIHNFTKLSSNLKSSPSKSFSIEVKADRPLGARIIGGPGDCGLVIESMILGRDGKPAQLEAQGVHPGHFLKRINNIDISPLPYMEASLHLKRLVKDGGVLEVSSKPNIKALKTMALQTLLLKKDPDGNALALLQRTIRRFRYRVKDVRTDAAYSAYLTVDIDPNNKTGGTFGPAAEGKGMRVISIESGGQLQEAGVQKSMIIVSVNGNQNFKTLSYNDAAKLVCNEIAKAKKFASIGAKCVLRFGFEPSEGSSNFAALHCFCMKADPLGKSTRIIQHAVKKWKVQKRIASKVTVIVRIDLMQRSSPTENVIIDMRGQNIVKFFECIESFKSAGTKIRKNFELITFLYPEGHDITRKIMPKDFVGYYVSKVDSLNVELMTFEDTMLLIERKSMHGQSCQIMLTSSLSKAWRLANAGIRLSRSRTVSKQVAKIRNEVARASGVGEVTLVLNPGLPLGISITSGFNGCGAILAGFRMINVGNSSVKRHGLIARDGRVRVGMIICKMEDMKTTDLEFSRVKRILLRLISSEKRYSLSFRALTADEIMKLSLEGIRSFHPHQQAAIKMQRSYRRLRIRKKQLRGK
eukprot:g7822.t1